jgi:hypothetical protein
MVLQLLRPTREGLARFQATARETVNRFLPIFMSDRENFDWLPQRL